MKRAAKIINNFGYPNCYLVSVGLFWPFPTLVLSSLFSRLKFLAFTSLLWSSLGFSHQLPIGGTGYGKGRICSCNHEDDQ